MTYRYRGPAVIEKTPSQGRKELAAQKTSAKDQRRERSRWNHSAPEELYADQERLTAT